MAAHSDAPAATSPLAAAGVSLVELLSALPSQGLRVDVSYEGVSHTVRVPLEGAGMTSVPRALAALATGPCRRAAPMRELAVLSGLTGSFPAGTSTLVLANAGGGKSTLLRFLAGRGAPSEGRVC